MTSKLSGFQKYIGDWGERMFPESTVTGQMAHLDLEVCELNEAFKIFYDNPSDENKKAVQAEIADVFILLIGIAHRMNFDLMIAAADKFRILQNRQWRPANEKGVFLHIEPAQDIVAFK